MVEKLGKIELASAEMAKKWMRKGLEQWTKWGANIQHRRIQHLGLRSQRQKVPYQEGLEARLAVRVR